MGRLPFSFTYRGGGAVQYRVWGVEGVYVGVLGASRGVGLFTGPKNRSLRESLCPDNSLNPDLSRKHALNASRRAFCKLLGSM